MPLILATVTPGEPEIFAALQGEGPSAGWPCAFVRLSRCNLACEWCDTAYTWRFAGDNRPHRDGIAFDRAANQVTLAEAEVAARIAALGKSRLVVTGGEPLLQAPALARLILNLKNIAHLPEMQIEVETNGTVIPAPALDALIHQYNVSPKLAHSGNPRELALVAQALAHFAADPRAFFKFVIAEPADVEEVQAIAAEYAIPRTRILLMPEGRDSAALRARAVWLSDICSQYEFRLSDRLHIHLSGDTRGT
jgi:7-carboxy-7-deazaguanine synthase